MASHLMSQIANAKESGRTHLDVSCDESMERALADLKTDEEYQVRCLEGTRHRISWTLGAVRARHTARTARKRMHNGQDKLIEDIVQWTMTETSEFIKKSASTGNTSARMDFPTRVMERVTDRVREELTALGFNVSYARKATWMINWE